MKKTKKNKKKNKVLKVLLIIIGIIMFIIAFNYFRIYVYYLVNKDNYTETIEVQGNNNKYVPQGVTYSSEYNVVIQTSYNKNHKVSKIYITDLDNNKLIKTLNLHKEDNSINNNHVGGITTDNNKVWITNDYEVNEYSLDEIMNTDNKYIKSIKDTKLPIRGDFTLYKNNTLYIGEFYFPITYTVKDDNPLLYAYTNIDNINYNKPDYIISLPSMVQGMEIDKDNNFMFTGSYTYFHNSYFRVYKDVTKEKPSTYTLNNKKIPYYIFNNSNLIGKTKLPPMAEGMYYKDNKLNVLFESSTDAYLNAFPRIDKVIEYNYKEVLK